LLDSSAFDFTMPTIASGVEYDTIAREWRCKWSDDSNKKSLEELQKALLEVMPKINDVGGTRTQRVVCGSCKDFKVITTMKADKFPKWEESKFEPEAEFLETIKKISGVSGVETQTYTIMPVRYTPPPKLKQAKVWQIGRLRPDAKSFNLEAKVLDEPKEVETKGAAKIYEVTIGDSSGKIVCSLKDDQKDALKKDKVAFFRNGKVTMIKGHMRLVVDKWGKIDASDATIAEIGDKDVSAQEFELVKE